MAQRRKRSFSVKAEGIELVEQKMREQGITSREHLAEKTNLGVATVNHFFNPDWGRDPQRSTVEAIAKALDINPSNIVEGWHRVTRPSKEPPVFSEFPYWKQVCCDVLEKQNRQWLTTYPLGSGARRVADMYVPLELVERREPSARANQPINPAQWSVRETEKTTPILPNQFFEDVIKQGKSSKSQGKRIAIVGEPGAGKTTLLQKIALEVDSYPIWINLADLKPEDTLQGYLLEKWLKPSLSIIRQYAPEVVPNLREPTEALETAFLEAFGQGQICLLLDGMDEMAATLGQPLTWIAKELQNGWVIEAKIVLTCRVNVWSAEGSRLENQFDVYRNLDFSPEQVEEFIDKWFANLQEHPSRNALKDELGRKGDRINRLVRNPLRLTLICLTWKGLGDKLPETKAGLYQRLLKRHYQWKEDRQGFVIPEKRRGELERQLGELAKAALDSKEARFRLRESAVEKFLGCRKQNQPEEQSLFWWADKLGWLIPIGLPSVEEKDADETVYAFFHPTFQEYFAALAIDDWDDFLPNSHEEEPTTNRQGKCEYRIFEPQWKEAILLWLGRSDAAIEDEQKEAFMEALINFRDGCGKEKAYQYSSYFLAIAGTSEYKFRRSLEVINQVFIWGLWCDELTTSSVPFLQSARFSIASADIKMVSAILVKILLSNEESRLQIDAVKLADTLHIKDAEVIEALFILMNKTSDTRIRCETAFALAKVSRKQEAIDALIKLLKTKEFGRASQCLEELHIKSPKTIAALEETINNKLYDSFSDTDVYLAARSLFNFDPDNITAKRALNFLSRNTWINTLRSLANDVLGESGSDIQAEADLAESESQSSHYEILTHQLIDLGAELDSDAMNTVNSLTNLICRSLDESVRDTATWCLETIVTSKLVVTEPFFLSQVVTKVKACFDNFEERNDPRKIIVSFGITQKPHMGCSKVLWHCAQNMSYPEFYDAWHSPLSTNNSAAVVDRPF